MPPSEGNDSRSRGKFYFLITTLLFILLSSTLTAYLLASKKVNHSAEHSHRHNYQEVEEDDPPEELTCEQLTRTRSQDEYWNCMVYGATKFLLPDERAKIDAELQQPGKEGYRILKRTPSSNKGKILKRVKRGLHGPYQLLNSKDYSLTITEIKASDFTVRDDANDPYFFETIYMYKLTHETWQAQPPWSYTGSYGVKKWHTLNLDKFLVPINKKLDPINKENRLMKAVFTDLWDENKFTSKKGENVNFTRVFFGEDKTNRRLFYRLFYAHPYPDKRMIGHDWKPGKIFVIEDPDDATKDHIEVSNRVLTSDVLPRKVDENAIGGKDDDKKFTGYYSFMRFYIANRPTQEDIDNNPNVLSPALLNDLPPTGMDFRKIIKIIKKQSDHYKGIHKLTKEETDFHRYMGKVAGALGFVRDPQKKAFGRLVPLDDQLIEWIQTNLEENKLSQQRSQSRYSIDIFPVKFPICADKEPSPLDIVPKNAKDSSLVPYELDDNGFRFYRFSMYFPPDGTSSVFVQWDGATRENRRAVKLQAGGPPSLQQLYFEVLNIKIGMERNKGSEHRMDGKQYDMELQFLFTMDGPSGDQPFWFTLSRQLNDLFPYRGKLVHIISVLVSVDDTLKPDSDEALLFEPFAQTAYALRQQIEKTPSDSHYRKFKTKDFVVRLIDFFPKESVYYNYRGGLTIPPCFGYITWSVFEKPIKIMPQQYTEFKFMKAPAENSGFMAGNIRTSDDIWTSYENAPGILPSEKEKRKKERIDRTVLKSLPDTGVKKLKSENYDYYFDYDGGRIPKPSRMLMLLLILLIVSFAIVF